MQKMSAKLTWSIVYTLIGGLIFILGLNLLQVLPAGLRDAYKLGLPVLLLLAYLISRKYSPAQETVFLAFFLVCLGWSADYYLTGKIREFFSLDTGQLTGIAVTMVISTVLVCLPVLLGWRMSGRPFSELYLKGSTDLRGILTGLAGLLLFGGLGLLQARNQSLEFSVILAALPLALLFSLANAFREELTYRAALLKGFQANIGSLATILVTTLVFTVAHVDVRYIPPDQVVFVIGLLLIGYFGSWIMFKTGSLLGSVLFHAGADVMLILGLLASGQLILP